MYVVTRSVNPPSSDELTAAGTANGRARSGSASRPGRGLAVVMFTPQPAISCTHTSDNSHCPDIYRLSLQINYASQIKKFFN